MTGIAPETLKIFRDVARLECISDFVLVGGTALAIQINHRLSEDLDFCNWVKTSTPKTAIPFRSIERELRESFQTVQANPIDFDQADFIVNGKVKLQFFNEIGHHPPQYAHLGLEGRMRMAPIPTLGAMKIKTMFQRSTFRDYYDVYSLVKGGHVSLDALLREACGYDRRLKPQMISLRLRDHRKFREESSFKTLEPLHSVTTTMIGEFFEMELARIKLP